MQPMMDKDYVAGISGALVILSAIMVDALDKSGALSKVDFANRLRTTAEEAEETEKAERGERPRYDLFLIRRVASILASPEPPAWTPEVIHGGKSDHSD
jgi:hypothetical protein